MWCRDQRFGNLLQLWRKFHKSWILCHSPHWKNLPPSLKNSHRTKCMMKSSYGSFLANQSVCIKLIVGIEYYISLAYIYAWRMKKLKPLPYEIFWRNRLQLILNELFKSYVPILNGIRISLILPWMIKVYVKCISLVSSDP